MLKNIQLSAPIHKSDRAELYEELHRRAPVPLAAGTMCSHVTVHVQNDAYEDLKVLCTHVGITPPPPHSRQYVSNAGAFRLKWERHTEFCTYSFYLETNKWGAAFAAAPQEWHERISPHILTAVHIAIQQQETHKTETLKPPKGLFAGEAVAGGLVCDGHAVLWSDFRLQDDGFSKILVIDKGLKPRRAGRLVQRLIDIETYRVVALLGLDDAHHVNAVVTKIEQALHELMETRGFPTIENPDRELLDSLLILASQTEALLSQSSFRFDATAAYGKLVFRRLDELSEQRIQGAQRLSNFVKRRFIPAIDTCDAAANRLTELTQRIHRDAALIRTRIDVARQEQNNLLLESMDKRATLQFKLQQTVEAISAVAISYYAISIFGIFAKSIAAMWPQIEAPVLTGIAAPFIIAFVIWSVRRIRRHVG